MKAFSRNGFSFLAMFDDNRVIELIIYKKKLYKGMLYFRAFTFYTPAEPPTKAIDVYIFWTYIIVLSIEYFDHYYTYFI